MFYMITPPNETEWCVSRAELLSLLRRNWPESETRVRDDPLLPAGDVEWKIVVDGQELEGSQDRSGQTQYLNGAIQVVASYALWWRQQVPPTQELIICDEAYSSVLTLSNDVSEAEIVSAFDGE